jgi:hypothetical protein
VHHQPLRQDYRQPFFRVTYHLILLCLFLFRKYWPTLKIIISRQAGANYSDGPDHIIIALSLFTTSTASFPLCHHYWIAVDAAKILEQATNSPETSRRVNIDKK